MERKNLSNALDAFLETSECEVSQCRDVLENIIYQIDPLTLSNLLRDRSTGRNIRWATRDYVSRGVKGYGEWDRITVDLIVRRNGYVIQPRVDKSAAEQRARSVDRAEVFTPSWVCNKQNNLIDSAWFGRANAGFNEEIDAGEHTWRTLSSPIVFDCGRKWSDYVKAPRLEVSCGEAPYLTSRYDTVTGRYVEPCERIGFLDRKLRVITENVESRAQWLESAIDAVKATYGFEYQGDSLLIARENILFAVKEYFEAVFSEDIPVEFFRRCSEVISWNIWQMDALKYVVPGTCHNEPQVQLDLFDAPAEERICLGCKTGDVARHNGVRCRIMDWQNGEKVLFMPPFNFKPIAKEKSDE